MTSSASSSRKPTATASKVKDGPIIAAEFQNRGRTLRAVRYTTPDGRTDYYADDGRSMRKAFLRTPMDVYRISSHFDPNRRHPVMNTIRAHKGTDYAAPTGTPIKASGDGRIIHIGRKGGYGNAIILKHGGRYTTLYGHMSRFAEGLHNGSRVEQGQTIGYVGSTGLATGPHLHYEFRVNGVHKDPVKVELPKADSIPEKLQADFKQSTQPLLAELDELERYDGELEVADHQVDDRVMLAIGEPADGDSKTR
ncbi:MAG: peptidoglycan DD-metalloendopeptidase family protein [Gammaproteobacteria bacterium]|nr:peptidoglycan DD-metalloendopeptidase family protein [Gammaproteobacteria bacterium]